MKNEKNINIEETRLEDSAGVAFFKEMGLKVSSENIYTRELIERFNSLKKETQALIRTSFLRP